MEALAAWPPTTDGRTEVLISMHKQRHAGPRDSIRARHEIYPQLSPEFHGRDRETPGKTQEAEKPDGTIPGGICVVQAKVMDDGFGGMNGVWLDMNGQKHRTPFV